MLSFKGRGGVVEARKLSYRSLDVEQIGHVYEGLLDHSVVLVDEVALGLSGKAEAEVALALVENRAAIGHDALVTWLAEQTGSSASAVSRALQAEPDPDALARLASACDNDAVIAKRVEPYLGLLREDLRGLPQVWLPGSFVVTASGDRRSSGTYYTPKSLAEEMVRHALEPLVYSPGPAEGAARQDWRLRPARELVELKVCDMAMGSGAFLVATCRYLAARLVEAWAAEARPIPLPAEEADRETLALRVVAERCVYGVDRNPMAVEMAKLSLWLVTLAKDRPFSFVDHALRAGDSLLGITDLRQLHHLHLDPDAGGPLQANLYPPTEVVAPLVAEAVAARRELESFPVLDVLDAEEKFRLFRRARSALSCLAVIGDVVVGAALSTATQKADALESRLVSIAPEVRDALDPARSENDRAARIDDLERRAQYWLDEGRPAMAPDRACLHWPLEFPEVFAEREKPGFDAVVGNPPFLGGKRISGPLGNSYREHLVRSVAGGRTGNADLVTYFFLRVASLVRPGGGVALLATNTIARATPARLASTG